MSAFLIAASVVIGLVIGSFLNVVVWRLPRGESLSQPPSHCPKCGNRIRPYDNVPVLGWLWLRGRCRDCAEPISPRYPAVEAVTGLLFGVMAWRIGAHVSLVGFLWLTAAGVALTLIDVDVMRLPDAITFPTYGVGVVALAVDAAVRGRWWPFERALISMLGLFAFYFAVMMLGEIALRKRAMGFGDVKLSGILGLFLGWLSVGSLVVGVFAGFLLGGVGGVLLIASGRGKLASRIPYGPYMLAGALLAILWGQDVWHWYTGLSG